MVLASVMLLLLAAWWWFSPSGSGEYADSPDGKYRASASHLVQGTLLNGRVRYVEVEVTDRGSGKTIWTFRRYGSSSETVPDFENRSRRHLRWTPDSSAVSVPVGGVSDVTLPVP
jgi:hypothetical protein